ncbi:MAG: formyltransferase family protein [Oscillospiraceae bacterium]
MGVYTKVDTPENRGMKLLPSPVKAYAEAVGLPVYQPQSFLGGEQTVQQLRELNSYLLVVVAYGKILQAVLDIPTHGAINMHSQHPAGAARLRPGAALDPESLRRGGRHRHVLSWGRTRAISSRS